MSRFGSDPQEFFDEVYRDVPPWDVGGAQPDMAALLDELPPRGLVLDAGCGSGDLVIHVARMSVDVVGVDFVEAAIEHARAKVRELPPDVASRIELHVGDALRPSKLGREFGAIVDSGFLHLFTPEETDAYVDDVARALSPGGRFYLHAFATEFPIPNTPRAVGEEEVRARFTEERGWRILVLRPAEFHSRIAPVPATIACIERI